MKKLVVLLFLNIFFLALGSISPVRAASSTGICGYNPTLFPKCPETHNSCTTNSQCCVGVCIPPTASITTDAQCNGNSACLQALAEARADALHNNEPLWSVYQTGPNTYTTVCLNGWIDHTFTGGATVTPSPSPTPAPACDANCSTSKDCSGAKDGCNICTNGACSAPTPTPTPAPACGASCSTRADCTSAKDGCTSCIAGVCKAPACGATCATDKDCTGTKDGCNICTNGACSAPTPTPTLTPVPACGVSCSTPADCAATKDGCTACIGGVCKAPACGATCATDKDCVGAKDGCNICTNSACVAPSPTPSPSLTPVPACGAACSANKDCVSAKDGCTICSNNACVAPSPTPSPTPVAACGATCSADKDCSAAKDGCTSCVSGVCKVPFNPAACTCDGVDNSQLFTGSNAVITAYAKVIGTDTSTAQVVDQSFFLAQGNETTGTIIAKSGPIPASVISTSPTLVRYQSQWQLTMPNLTPGATYRLWSQINCQPKTTAMNMSTNPTHVVLATQTQTSLLGSIMNFFSNLLAGFTGSSTHTTNAAPTSTPTPATDTKTLQLQTLYPAQVIQKTCTFIKFKVQGLQ